MIAVNVVVMLWVVGVTGVIVGRLIGRLSDALDALSNDGLLDEFFQGCLILILLGLGGAAVSWLLATLYVSIYGVP